MISFNDSFIKLGLITTQSPGNILIKDKPILFRKIYIHNFYFTPKSPLFENLSKTVLPNEPVPSLMSNTLPLNIRLLLLSYY